MSAAIEQEIAERTRELAAGRTALARRVEELFALSLREVTATRALPACRDALVLEQQRSATLTKAHADAKAARLTREEESAHSDSDGGGCGCE